MRTLRFFTPQPLTENSLLTLGDETAHHAFTVLRLKEGTALTVFNGEGGEYEATIISANKKAVMIQTGAFNSTNNESPLKTHLAIGLSKGDRFDFVLQKTTELGVNTITPLFTERTEVRLSAEKQGKIQQRWQKIIINACEQCGRNCLPVLNNPVALHELLKHESSTLKLVLHPATGSNTQQNLSALGKTNSVCLLVGPEGGFSDMEFNQATGQGFAPLTLGPRVLRTETAPLTALSIIQYLWGDLS